MLHPTINQKNQTTYIVSSPQIPTFCVHVFPHLVPPPMTFPMASPIQVTSAPLHVPNPRSTRHAKASWLAAHTPPAAWAHYSMKPANKPYACVKSGRPKTIQNAYNPSKTLKKYKSWPTCHLFFFFSAWVGSPQTLCAMRFRIAMLPTSGNTTHRDLGLELQCGTCAARDSHLMGFWWIVKNPRCKQGM